MNKTWLGIGLAVILVGGAFWFAGGPGAQISQNSEVAMEEGADGNTKAGSQATSGKKSTGTSGATPSSGQARVVFSVTDKAAEMSQISEINMTVNKLEVHKEGGAWTTVSTAVKTYSLLELSRTNEWKLWVDAKLAAGIYDQIRLNIDDITIKTRAGAIKTAKLPSGVLKINTRIVAKNATTSSVNMDFLAKESLHETGLGDYIFAPVLRIDSSSEANLTIATNGNVDVKSGRKELIHNLGMDIDGSIKAGFSINPQEALGIDVNGKIVVVEEED